MNTYPDLYSRQLLTGTMLNHCRESVRNVVIGLFYSNTTETLPLSQGKTTLYYPFTWKVGSPGTAPERSWSSAGSFIHALSRKRCTGQMTTGFSNAAVYAPCRLAIKSVRAPEVVAALEKPAERIQFESLPITRIHTVYTAEYFAYSPFRGMPVCSPGRTGKARAA